MRPPTDFASFTPLLGDDANCVNLPLLEAVLAGLWQERRRDLWTLGIALFSVSIGVPAFSPHDPRHRRATLWHLGGVPAAQASAWLGHSAQEHLRTYAHAVLDRTELDYEDALKSELAR